MVSDQVGPSRSAIEVDRIEKSFRVARQRSESSRLRWLPNRYEPLEVLRGVSFTVEQGELFGIMGRNGSGKSTLLKIISGVYPADAGSVHVEGTLAPALELGVGFSPELSSSENAAINAVMLGLSRREARRRVASILDFADLGDFSETRLKDLSSGMRMRLAFAALIETDPDVLMIDEILAVGDRAFQEKCTEAFAAFRKKGRTIVLVTHATGLIERLCDRALLLENGQVETVGDPGEVAARYIEVNLPDGPGEAEMIDDGDDRRGAIQITDASLSAAQGVERTSVGMDREIAIEATLEVQQPVERPGLRIEIHNERGGRTFLSPTIPLGSLTAGESPRVRAWVENRLHPGEYSAQPRHRQARRAGQRRAGLAGRASAAADPGCPGRWRSRGTAARRHPRAIYRGHEGGRGMSDAAATLERVPPPAPENAGSRRRFWDLVLIMALTEYRRRYAGSVLGYAWALLRPLMLFAVLYIVFTRVIRFGGSVPDYPVLLLFNITLFFFFQEGTNAGLRAFVNRGSIMRSLKVPALATPLAAILAAAFTFAASLVVAIVWVLAYGVEPTSTWLLLPVLLLDLGVITVAVGILLSVLFVSFRDVGQAWHPISRLLFYASPVIFPFDYIPAGILRTIAATNPLSPLFVQARHWIIDPTAPTWTEATSNTFQTVAPFAVTLVLCALAAITFRHTRSRIAERL